MRGALGASASASVSSNAVVWRPAGKSDGYADALCL